MIMDKVKLGKFSFETEEWNYVSKEAKDFICRLLEKDPKKRLSVNNFFFNNLNLTLIIRLLKL